MLQENLEEQNKQQEVNNEPSEPEVLDLDQYEVVDEPMEEEEETEEQVLTPQENQLLQEDSGGLEEAPNEVDVLRKKLKDARKKADKAHRNTYSMANEISTLKKELEEAKRNFQFASQVGNENLLKEADLRIDAAWQKIKEARELGDIEAEKVALNDLHQANILKSKAQDHRYHQQLEQEAINQEMAQQQAPQPVFNPYEYNREMVSEFVERNSYWMDDRSPQYNPSLVSGLNDFMEEWNDNLMRNGYQDYIGSDDYNSILQQKVDEAHRNINAQTRRVPKMKTVGHAAAPVRNNARINNSPNKRALTRDEYELMNEFRKIGVKPNVDKFLQIRGRR